MRGEHTSGTGVILSNLSRLSIQQVLEGFPCTDDEAPGAL